MIKSLETIVHKVSYRLIRHTAFNTSYNIVQYIVLAIDPELIV